MISNRITLKFVSAFFIVLIHPACFVHAGLNPAKTISAETAYDNNSGFKGETNMVYMFCYFVNNGEDGLHLAYSKDGLKWTALFNNNSVLRPAVGDDKLMRDPCIIRGGDGKFHMVWTVSWKERSIGYASSSDLIHWSEQQDIAVMSNEPNAQNCWAPEIFYDSQSKQYLIYWATTIKGRFPETEVVNESNHRIYYVTTKDFRTYSKTKLLYNHGYSVIDATIQQYSKKYLMFIKDEREPKDGTKKKLYLTTSDALTSGYSDSIAITSNEYAAEGPTVTKIADKWIVYFDKYMIGKYGAVSSSDLIHWTDISAQISLPTGIRHGSIFMITQKEFEKIQK